MDASSVDITIGSTATARFTATSPSLLCDAINSTFLARSKARNDSEPTMIAGDIRAFARGSLVVVLTRHGAGSVVVVNPVADSMIPVVGMDLGAVGSAAVVDTTSAKSFVESLDVTSLLIGAAIGVVVAK